MSETSTALTLMLKAENHMRPAVEQAQASMGRLEKSAGASRAAFMALGGAVAGTVVGALSDFARAAAEEEIGVARLAQAVDNAGGSWAKHGEAIEAVIAERERLSFSDGDLRDSLSLLVSQTGDVTEAMKRQRLAMDFSRGANIDLQTASKLLGKVTDENVRVLSRYGINIEKGADATALFATVQQKFGGQSEAYASTTQGAIDRIRNSIDNWKESIGGALGPAQGLLMMLPGLQQGATLAGGAIGFLGAHSRDLGGGLKSLAAAINPVTLAKRAWALAQAALNLVMSANPIALVVLALGALAAGVKFAYDNFEGFRVLVDGVFAFLRNVFGPVLGWLGDRFGDLARAVGLSSSQSKTAATESFAGMSTEVVASTTGMATGVKADVKKIEDFVPAAFARMKEATVGNANDMKVDTILSAMGLSTGVREAVAEMVTGVTGKTAEERDAIIYNMQVAELQATLRARGLSENVVQAIDRMVYDSKLSMEELRRSASEKLARVHEAAAAQREKLEEAGANSARAFAEAIERDAYLAYRAGERLGQQAAAGANDALLIQSPSKVFAAIGKQITEGLGLGIKGNGAIPLGAIQEIIRKVVAVPSPEKLMTDVGEALVQGLGFSIKDAATIPAAAMEEAIANVIEAGRRVAEAKAADIANAVRQSLQEATREMARMAKDAAEIADRVRMDAARKAFEIARSPLPPALQGGPEGVGGVWADRTKVPDLWRAQMLAIGLDPSTGRDVTGPTGQRYRHYDKFDALKKIVADTVTMLPKFHQGGVMPYDGLANLRRGEHIVTPEAVRSASAPQIIQLVVDGAVLAQIVNGHNQRRIRQLGGSLG